MTRYSAGNSSKFVLINVYSEQIYTTNDEYNVKYATHLEEYKMKCDAIRNAVHATRYNEMQYHTNNEFL